MENDYDEFDEAEEAVHEWVLHEAGPKQLEELQQLINQELNSWRNRQASA